MTTDLDPSALTELLPGTWAVSATNFPIWLSAERTNPTLTYELVANDPLTLAVDVSYRTAEGEGHIVGRDRWRHDGFTRRGKGWSRFAGSRWNVVGASDDRSILTVRFAHSRAIPAGIDVLVREGSPHPELRATIARSTEQFGLTPEDFASLTWLAPVPRA